MFSKISLCSLFTPGVISFIILLVIILLLAMALLIFKIDSSDIASLVILAPSVLFFIIGGFFSIWVTAIVFFFGYTLNKLRCYLWLGKRYTKCGTFRRKKQKAFTMKLPNEIFQLEIISKRSWRNFKWAQIAIFDTDRWYLKN